ncbi:restriction endonuclease subunit S [Rhodanobacter sp. L36]|uniref:restriction endonuclease subunit S n=1 Tax=Rhodanobacter sp. L36 TaxID=1747221 RepID=UPI00131C40F3|nr:restriction endonuclease subunit S [Rhodanobacter sp. L36]
MSSVESVKKVGPAGSCLASIGDVIDQRISQSGPDTDFLYLDIGSVDRETKQLVNLKTVALQEAPSRAKQVVAEADVLVSMTRPNLNAVAIVPHSAQGAIASTGFHVLRSRWVDTKLLFYLVQTDAFVEAMCAVVQGALYPAVRPKDIDGFEFHLPPAAEQTRIVEKLEELLSDLDAGVAELKAAQRKLAQYRQSLLKDATEGALTADWRAARAQIGESQETGTELLKHILTQRRTRWEASQLANFAEEGKTPPKGWQVKYREPVAPDAVDLPSLPDGWAWASVDQLSFVVRGASPRPAGDPRYFGGAIPWITVGSLTADEGMYLDQVDQFVTSAGRDASRYIEPGTLLLTNSGATLGVPKITRIGGCINDGLVALLDVCDPFKIYLYWYLRTQTKRLRALNQGAAQPNLNTAIVKKICVPICGNVEMALINSLLDATVEAVELQRVSIEGGISRSNAQRKNILKAAFAGQLVPQDPGDEPASVLLERICADRATWRNQPKAPKIKKQKEIANVMSKLIDVLAEADDWLRAQEAFRRCGAADGAQTSQIEPLYAELRDLHKAGRLEVKSEEDAEGRKLGDLLKLRTI